MKKLEIVKQIWFYAIIIGLSTHTSLYAQYRLKPAFPNLNFGNIISDIQHADDGTNRLFVVDKDGLIWVIQNDSSVTQKKVFLNIEPNVASFSEAGLLGLAFHPDYKLTGYFYVNYNTITHDSLFTIVARYQVSDSNPDSALANSELVLLRIPQPDRRHNAGQLFFGPQDGYLYIATGDGGLSDQGGLGENAQNLKNLLGAILRIDINTMSSSKNYSIPPDNPFVGNTFGYREEIYAYGFRNPWRFSIDSLTNQIWVGDVGHGSFEEIDIIKKGGNYGWNIMEGFHCFPSNTACDTLAFELPIWEYPHHGSSAIIGGFVYRGNIFPELYNTYIYGDNVSGQMWSLKYDGQTAIENTELVDSDLYFTTFGVDQNKEFYIASTFLDQNFIDANIYRLIPIDTFLEGTIESNTSFYLQQNFPNPFNPLTTIQYNLPKASPVVLTIFTVLGQKIRILVNKYQVAGEHSAIWDGRVQGGAEVGSGIYIYRIEAGKYMQSRKMLLIR